MNVYIILKQGVYIQGVVGVLTGLESAIEKAKALADNEKDDYHEFDVYQFTSDGEEEGRLIFSVRNELEQNPASEIDRVIFLRHLKRQSMS